MNCETIRSILTVQIPPGDLSDELTAAMPSPFPLNSVSVNLDGNATSPNGDTTIFDTLGALHRYLPTNFVSDSDLVNDDVCDIPVDVSSSDHFRMFEFKVRKCARGRSHDWTECPYSHPGEKARRRDPRKYHYSGTPCPEFRVSHCQKGDLCEFAHGVFECWLHPARYRTQSCKDGTHCRRRICFFAHTPDQLRVLPQSSPRLSDSFDMSPSGLGFDSCLTKLSFGSSPNSTLYSPPASDSPPMSPIGSMGVNSVSDLASSIRNLQIGKVRMSMSPPAWGVQMGSGHCSPRSPSALGHSFLTHPSTPIRGPTRTGLGVFDHWDENGGEEEPAMERVESGRELRAKLYAKLSKENSLKGVDSVAPSPDVGWISELVK